MRIKPEFGIQRELIISLHILTRSLEYIVLVAPEYVYHLIEKLVCLINYVLH